MKTNKYFLITVITLLACNCKNEMELHVQPTPGEEVKFGAVLEENASRTSYGPGTQDENGKIVSYPIYWEDGDEVLVFSPDCNDGYGIGSATYKVNVGENSEQDFANSLDKIGDKGVRWGNNSTADFFSIYPASSLYTKVENDCKKLTLTMPVQQDNNFERMSDGTIVTYPDMRACFMYAYSYGVQNGQTVNLKYKPLTTAIRFTLVGPTDGDITINYVRIYAPENTFINGTYIFEDVTKKDGIPTATSGRNYVTMNVADSKTGSYLTLAPGEKVELNAFLLLGEQISITEGWYIEVGSASGMSYKLNIGAASTNSSNTLVPTKVHKLKELPPLKSDEWNPSNWMKNLQRNVYLSEISLPGSWNTMNGEYQPNNVVISNQYNAGVRAFHLDTRWKAKVFGAIPTGELGIANGGTSYGSDGDRYMSNNAPSFETSLREIVSNVKSDEYMVVMCTFAQGSADYEYETGKYWIHKISEICNNINSDSDSRYKDKICDGSKLTKESVVADVLGKVIVIVNTKKEVQIDNSRCIFMNMLMELEEDDFKNNDYLIRNLKYNNFFDTYIDVYATHAQITINDKGTTNGTSDSGRGYIPTLLERKNKVESILNKSKENHENIAEYAHDVWLYMGLGGYVGNDDITPVRDYFSEYMGGKLDDMVNNGYYPIGIVLINDVASSNVSSSNVSLVQTILEMNNKYRKAYDPNRSPVDGAYINGTNGIQSVAPGYSSGMTDNDVDAIGWSRCR